MDEVRNGDLDAYLIRMKKLYRESVAPKKETAVMDSGLGFTIHIPDGFSEKFHDELKRIFRTINRPQVLLINAEENAGITFQLLDEQSGVQADCQWAVKQIETIDSKVVFYDTGVCGQGNRIAWAEYKSFASDERVYNLIFLFGSSAGMVLGTFYCIFKDYPSWKKVIFKMLETIEIA